MRLDTLHPQFLFDRWSRTSGWLQQCDPRAKSAAVLLLLLGVSLSVPATLPAVARLYAGGTLLWLLLTLSSRLPVGALLARALLVLPFTAVYALVSWWSGETTRAAAVSAKALLSAQYAVLLAASTPIEDLLAGLHRWHAPPFLLTIVLLIYRYLFVIAGQVRRMQMAAEARGSRRAFRAVAGSVAVLFAKSHQRATGLHRAMLARGYRGAFPPLRPLHLGARDVALLAASAPLTFALYWVGRP